MNKELKKEAFALYGTMSPAKHDVIERMKSELSEEEFQGAMKMLVEFQKFYVLPCGHQAGDWVEVYFGPGMSNDNSKITKVHLAGFSTTYDVEINFEGVSEIDGEPFNYTQRLYNVPSANISRKDKKSDFMDYIIIHK